MISLLSFIFLFLVVTLTHEIGHFIAARLSGIRIYELALGIGPKLYSFQRGDTLYSLNLLPVAGYVRIAGISPEDLEEASCPDSYKYEFKPPHKKFFTICSGAVFNIIFAFLVFCIINLSFGIPDKITNEIQSIVPNSEASRIGLLPGDRIISLNSLPGSDMKTIISFIHDNPGLPLKLKVSRKDNPLNFTATPRFDPKFKIGLLGFKPGTSFRKVAFLDSLSVSASQVVGICYAVVFSLFLLFTGQASILDLIGPIGIAKMSGDFAASGFYSYMQFMAFFSVNVGILNLLPIPALDGGRLVFILIEFFRKKRLDLRVENRIHAGGFSILLIFIAVLSINDVLRLIFKF